MSRAELRWEGEVALLVMRHEENRFHPEMLQAIGRGLDEVEQRDGAAAVVLTGEGKFFSNGLDLEYLSSASAEEAARVLADVHRLLARVLAFPRPVIGALNGHAFAAGAMLAMACDFRVMRSGRGYFCLPEVDLGFPFTPGMNGLLLARLRPQVAHEAMATGRRYTAEEAQAAEIVDDVAAEPDVLPVAIGRARTLAGKPPHALSTIKSGLYARVLADLRQPPVP